MCACVRGGKVNELQVRLISSSWNRMVTSGEEVLGFQCDSLERTVSGGTQVRKLPRSFIG